VQAQVRALLVAAAAAVAETLALTQMMMVVVVVVVVVVAVVVALAVPGVVVEGLRAHLEPVTIARRTRPAYPMSSRSSAG
jgi:hypothetical protein